MLSAASGAGAVSLRWVGDLVSTGELMEAAAGGGAVTVRLGCCWWDGAKLGTAETAAEEEDTAPVSRSTSLG